MHHQRGFTQSYAVWSIECLRDLLGPLICHTHWGKIWKMKRPYVLIFSLKIPVSVLPIILWCGLVFLSLSKVIGKWSLQHSYFMTCTHLKTMRVVVANNLNLKSIVGLKQQFGNMVIFFLTPLLYWCYNYTFLYLTEGWPKEQSKE